MYDIYEQMIKKITLNSEQIVYDIDKDLVFDLLKLTKNPSSKEHLQKLVNDVLDQISNQNDNYNIIGSTDVKEKTLKIIAKDKGASQTNIDILELGINYKRLGQYKESLYCYQKALKIFPANAMAYYNMGKTLYLFGKYNMSMKAYSLAYMNHVNIFDSNLLLHIGHSFFDSINAIREKYKNYINMYTLSIAGFGGSIDGKYDKICHDIGVFVLDYYKQKFDKFYSGKEK